MAADLACDKFWVNKNMYHEAEKKYYENLAKLRKNEKGSMEVSGEETHLKKPKESKRVHGKRSGCIAVDPDALRKELVNLEARNLRNENINLRFENHKTFDFDGLEEVYCNEDHDYNATDSDKKNKQREGKEKKNKSEKKKKLKEEDILSLGGVGMANVTEDSFPKTSLAGEVAKARQHIKSSLQSMDKLNGVNNMANSRLTTLLEKMDASIQSLTLRVEALEKKCGGSCVETCKSVSKPSGKPQPTTTSKPPKDEDDDVDLFGSESEEEDEEAKRVREQRLAEYAAKKSKKPEVIAKSNIILDIKPWDDETDMKEMEKAVRAVEMDGLIWGASKLVPVAFKIFKLQISCVVEDDKVSVDLLTEKLEEIEDYIQSVDIAAFNKV